MRKSDGRNEPFFPWLGRRACSLRGETRLYSREFIGVTGPKIFHNGKAQYNTTVPHLNII